MRPGVIRNDGYAFRGAPLSGKEQAVIFGIAARIDRRHVAVVLALDGVLEEQLTALVGIRCRRASRVLNAGNCARPGSQEDRGIALLRGPYVDRVRTEISRRHHPIRYLSL